MRTVDAVLETLFSVFSHGAFGLLCALLLIVLVATNHIPIIVAASLFGAWIIVIVWLARLKSVKSLTVLSRLVVIVIGGTVLAIAANSFGEWALRESQQTTTEQPRPGPIEEAYLPLSHPGAISPLSPMPMPRDQRSATASLPKPEASQPNSQPNIIIQTGPVFGNLRDRAIGLSQEIMSALYQNGWPLQAGQPAPVFNNPTTKAEWNSGISGEFRLRYLHRLRDIRDECAQIHLRDPHLDEFFKYEAMRQDEATTLRASGKPVPDGMMNILPQQIQELAERLRVLADQINGR
jgi:hypothetical protein